MRKSSFKALSAQATDRGIRPGAGQAIVAGSPRTMNLRKGVNEKHSRRLMYVKFELSQPAEPIAVELPAIPFDLEVALKTS